MGDAVVDRVTVEFDGNASGMVKESKAAASAFTSFSQQVTRESQRVNASSGGVDRFVTGFGSLKAVLAGAGITAAVSQVVALGRAALDTGGQLADFADQTGIAVEQLQELQFAGQQVGVAAGEMEQGFQIFTRVLGEAKEGSGPLADSLRDSNAALLETLVTATSTGEALDIALGFLAGIGDEAKRAAVGSNLFGRSWGKLSRIVSDGGAALADVRKQARDTNTVLSLEEVDALDKAGDAWDRLKARVAVAGAKFVASVIEAGKTGAALAPPDFDPSTYEAGATAAQKFVEANDAAGVKTDEIGAGVRALGGFIATAARDFLAYAQGVNKWAAEVTGGQEKVSELQATIAKPAQLKIEALTIGIDDTLADVKAALAELKESGAAIAITGTKDPTVDAVIADVRAQMDELKLRETVLIDVAKDPHADQSFEEVSTQYETLKTSIESQPIQINLQGPPADAFKALLPEGALKSFNQALAGLEIESTAARLGGLDGAVEAVKAKFIEQNQASAVTKAQLDALGQAADAIGQKFRDSQQDVNFGKAVEDIQAVRQEAASLSFAGPDAELQAFNANLEFQANVLGTIANEDLPRLKSEASAAFAELAGAKVDATFNQLQESLRLSAENASLFGDTNEAALERAQADVQSYGAAIQDLLVQGFSSTSNEVQGLISAQRQAKDEAAAYAAEIERAAAAQRAATQDALRAEKGIQALLRGTTGKKFEIGIDVGAFEEQFKELTGATDDETSALERFRAEILQAQKDLGKFGSIGAFSGTNPFAGVLNQQANALQALIDQADAAILQARNLQSADLTRELDDAAASLSRFSRDNRDREILFNVRASGSPEKDFSTYFPDYALDRVGDFEDAASKSTIRFKANVDDVNVEPDRSTVSTSIVLTRTNELLENIAASSSVGAQASEKTASRIMGERHIASVTDRQRELFQRGGDRTSKFGRRSR